MEPIEELVDRFHMEKQWVSGHTVYVVPKEGWNGNWDIIIKWLGWNETQIQHRYLDTLKQFAHLPLFLGIVFIETNQKQYQWMPSLCFYKDEAYHLVQYRQEWFCQNCMYKTPPQWHGIPHVLIPASDFLGGNFPIPSFFEKKKCPYCGKPIHQPLFCLDEE